MTRPDAQPTDALHSQIQHDTFTRKTRQGPWVADCSCGWTGESWLHKEGATTEERAHLAAVRQS